MSRPSLVSRWQDGHPYLLSVLRIVAAYCFLFPRGVRESPESAQRTRVRT